VEELLAYVQWEGDIHAPTSWSLLFSPFADSLDLRAGFQFAVMDIGAADDISAADLDGDGLSDIISRYPMVSLGLGRGDLRIGYGADIMVAYEASKTSTP